MSEEISQSEIPKKKCYTCEICDNEFTFKCILVNHINRIHSDIGTSNKCDICSKSFTFLGNLKSHIKAIHERKKPFKCDSCDKYFSRSEHLSKHVTSVHEGRKDYKCESCHRSFSEKKSLKKHIQSVKQIDIINVDIVLNPLLQQNICRYIFIQFMNDKKITNLIPAENLLVFYQL